jgi:hypothetical protein
MFAGLVTREQAMIFIVLCSGAGGVLFTGVMNPPPPLPVWIKRDDKKPCSQITNANHRLLLCESGIPDFFTVSIFVKSFCPPGSESKSNSMRIRMRNTALHAATFPPSLKQQYLQ